MTMKVENNIMYQVCTYEHELLKDIEEEKNNIEMSDIMVDTEFECNLAMDFMTFEVFIVKTLMHIGNKIHNKIIVCEEEIKNINEKFVEMKSGVKLMKEDVLITDEYFCFQSTYAHWFFHEIQNCLFEHDFEDEDLNKTRKEVLGNIKFRVTVYDKDGQCPVSVSYPYGEEE